MRIPELQLSAGRLSDALSADYLVRHCLMPIARESDRVVVAFAGRPDPQALAELTLLFNLPLDLHEYPADELLGAIDASYGEGSASAAEVIAGLDGSAPSDGDEALVAHDLAELANQAPVIRLVNLLLSEALVAGASDVHLECEASSLRVRYRIDGMLRDAPTPPAHLRAAVVSRLKIMAELDIAERRLPQDGRVRLRLDGRDVDVRASTLPTLHGESVVLRLLEADGRRVSLDELGMGADTRGVLEGFCARPHGMLLVTGPTGSGKSTTMHALAERLRTGREKIVSVEDPVEYELPGVAQVPVQARTGLTFARALRSILRQDPDVLLVGEMRDAETAEICTQAALTGHLVLSTLHTNDAPGALLRLLDLAVADYLVASTVQVIVAQRLVRRLCGECRELVPLSDVVRRECEGDGHPLDVAWQAAGCSSCNGTGFRGRTGVYELLTIDDDMRGDFLVHRDARTLRALALARGMRSLRADGWRQVALGVTTPQEILRVARA